MRALFWLVCTIKNVMIVKAVLVTSCQGPLKLSHGPMAIQIKNAPKAPNSTGERLVQRAAAWEMRVNHDGGLPQSAKSSRAA